MVRCWIAYLFVILSLGAPAWSSTLPVFRMDNFTEAQHEQLWNLVRNCYPNEYTEPTDSIANFDCDNATPEALQTFTQRFASFNLSKPVKFRLENVRWNSPLAPLAPIRQNLIILELHDYTPLPVGFLDNLRLPNLLYLSVQRCTDIRLQASTFRNLPQLRILKLAIVNTFAGVNPNFFAPLPHLAVLSLEADYLQWADPGTLTPSGQMIFDMADTAGDRMPWVRALHCSCEFAWLRRLYQRRPTLIQPKASKEIFVYGDEGSPPERLGDLLIPFDCAKTGKDAVLSYKNFTSYSVNAPLCLPSLYQ